LVGREPSGGSGFQKAPMRAPDSKISGNNDNEKENHLLFRAAFIDFSQTGFTFRYINLKRRENGI
jgi:hypothetical protein